MRGRMQGWLFTQEVRKAISEDSVSLLELGMTLSGKRVTIGLLRRILKDNAWNILVHLLKSHTKAITSILSPQDLLISICAYGSSYGAKSDAAVRVLDALEESFPGISQHTDKLGNTPLWYCLYNGRKEKLEESLIKYGCEPDSRNHLNLSYNICKEFRNL